MRIHGRRRTTVGQGTRKMRPALGRTALVGALAAVAVLALAANALALSGTPIKVAEPVRYGPPAVAVDSAGTAYIAWSNTTGLAHMGYTIEYCALPAGATACAHHGTLIVEGAPEPVVGQVQVLVDGATVVLLAEVYGVHEKYEPVQEWTSTDGGAVFNAVNGGRSVANATINADTGPLNALLVPGTNALGYAFVTAGGPPTFDEFPFTSPPECSLAKCEPGEAFSTLQSEAETILHPLGNLHGSVASRLGTNPGVLGVYETLGKPGCASGSFDTAYVYGSGEQSPANSYDISPGKPDSAWRTALAPGDCEAEYVAAGGGPSGLGVVEKDLTRGYTVYHQFNQTSESFEPSTVTIAKEGELDASVSQDGAGGIYVTYLGNASDAIRLAYSSTGGASWTGPATLNPNADLSAGNLVSSVGSGGQGWAVWTDGESVYAQQFVASDAIPPPAPEPLPSPPPPPTSQFTSVGNPQVNIKNGQIVVIGQFPAPGTATSTGIVTQGATLARVADIDAEAARKHKKCKRGYVKKGKKCVSNKPVPYGTTTLTIPTAGTYSIVIKPTSKVLKALTAGKKLLVVVSTTFQNHAGGTPVTHVQDVFVKLTIHKHGKRHHRRR